MSAPNSEETIFAAARELPDSDRGDYLDRACGGDARLRQAVEGLLAADAGAGTFLGEPAVDLRRKRAPEALSAEQIGESIGPYKLVERLGEGGCGVVYVAEQEHPVRRKVALKVIRLGMDTKGVVARFEAERQALALMDHPNIARVLDAGATARGRPFFVMELVRGLKITEFCDQHKLTPRQRLELFVQVCRAVQHAHQKGIIHRDLKPSNILVTDQDGVPAPKVIDFGIAKATQGRLTDQTIHTALEQFIGTPAYMSPEQAQMRSLDVDTRSDLYSLGVLLYELLTGTTPFDTRELLQTGLDEVRRTIREEEPLRPSTRLRMMAGLELDTTSATRRTEAPKLIHLIRGDLDWIVMKCLEKDRGRRYETANGLAMDILRYLQDEPVLARPPSFGYQLRKMARRHRGALAAATSAFAAAVFALAALSVSYVRVKAEKSQREAALRIARDSEQEAKDQLFLALRNEARARRFSAQMGQRFDSLAALTQAAAIRRDETLRDEVIASLALPDIRRGPRWTALAPSTRAVAFDPSYERYARVDAPGILRLFKTGTGTELQRLNKNQDPISCSEGCLLLFSPDGTFLALRDSDLHLKVWRVTDGAMVLGEHLLEIWAVAFSSDSRRLAVGDEKTIHCYELATGKTLHQWPVPAQPYTMAFSPDDSRLAIGYLQPTNLTVLDTGSGSVLAELPVGKSTQEIVVWHPDGERVAFAGSDPRIQIWNVNSRSKEASLEGSAQQVTLLAFHPGGELLASDGWEGVMRLWEPGSCRQVIKLPFGVQVGFSRTGSWLGVAWEDGNRAQLFEASPSEPYHTFVAHQTRGENILYDGDISSSLRVLAMGMDDGVHVFDLQTRRELASLSLGTTLSAHFNDEQNALVTSGPRAGLQRWPIQRTSGALRIGPAQRVDLPFTPMRVTTRGGGTVCAVVSEEDNATRLIDLKTGSVIGAPLNHQGVSFAALSPDGEFLATSGWHSSLVRLWKCETAELVKEWKLRGPLKVSFTLDGRELIICRDGGFDFIDLRKLVATRTIPRENEVYPGHVAFSPDGALMAMEISPGVVQLKDAGTGRTVAKLSDPFGDRATWMSFTPDGTQLVMAARYAGVLHLWDLRALREPLKALDLDWNWPEFPPVQTAGPPKSFTSAPPRDALKARQTP